MTMRYELTVSESLDPVEAEVVRAYWALENGVFAHKADALAAKHGLTVPKLTALAQAGTVCRVSLGHCLGCGDEVVHTLANRSAFTTHLHDFEPPRCSDCKRAHHKRQKFETDLMASTAVSELGVNAVELNAWDYLTPEEAGVLRGIVQHKTKRLIYEHVFQGDYNNKAVWLIVKRLEQRSLIAVRRDYAGAVEEFVFRPEVEAVLNVPPSDPDTHTAFFNVRLQKNRGKTIVQQPDFSGACAMLSTVELAANARLGYAAWLTKKGDLLLQIAPLEQVKRYQKPDSGSPEPVSIRQVIERLFSAPDADGFD